MRTLWLAGLLAIAACSHGPKEHQVAIRAMQFVPANVEVDVNDVIVWTNEDIVPHTVTAAGAFDSQALTAKQQWRYTVTNAGTQDYGCTFHPTMKGRITAR